MGPRYTETDMAILHKWLSKYPSNYSEGFRKAAEELGRAYASVASTFYTSRKMKSYFLEHPIQGLLSNEKAVEINRKNCPNIPGKTHPDLHQVDIHPVGIVQSSPNSVVIRMQTASFQIGGIQITGENIEVRTFLYKLCLEIGRVLYIFNN